jgi:hypothetical protein
MIRGLGVAALMGSLAPLAGIAYAGHDMADHDHAPTSSVSVGVALQAAEFETRAYVGNYQSIAPSLGWTRGRFAASATVGLYHLEENGLGKTGFGDVMLGGHATVFDRDALDAGVALHVMLPTGAEADDLGMGHMMVAPTLWAAWRADPVTLAASAGYARALTTADGAAHDHGPAPLVDPMNMQELTWSASADVDVGHRIRLGGRALGAIPTDTGQSRVIGGGRVRWGTERVSTAFELQVGVVGDPFIVRGVVETTLRF